MCGFDTCQNCVQNSLIGNWSDKRTKEHKEQVAGIDWMAMGVNWDTNKANSDGPNRTVDIESEEVIKSN